MKSWLRCAGRDGNQHVLYLPESARHTLSTSCACKPRIVNHVIVHAVITCTVARQRMERDH